MTKIVSRCHSKFLWPRCCCLGTRELSYTMATSCQASRSQTRPIVQHLKNRRALHLNLKRKSHNNLGVLSKTKFSNYHCHNSVALPNSPKENLTNYHHSSLKTGLSEAHGRSVKFNSSNSLNCNVKRDMSSPQLRAIAEKYEDDLPKLRPHKAPSHLHLRLNTSEDLRQVRVDGSPFEVRWNYDLFCPLKEVFLFWLPVSLAWLSRCKFGDTVVILSVGLPDTRIKEFSSFLIISLQFLQPNTGTVFEIQ
jgi:hypothetical protein